MIHSTTNLKGILKMRNNKRGLRVEVNLYKRWGSNLRFQERRQHFTIKQLQKGESKLTQLILLRQIVVIG